MSTLAKHTFIAALALLIAGPLLLFGDTWIVGTAALQQALPISVLAAVAKAVQMKNRRMYLKSFIGTFI